MEIESRRIEKKVAASVFNFLSTSFCAVKFFTLFNSVSSVEDSMASWETDILKLDQACRTAEFGVWIGWKYNKPGKTKITKRHRSHFLVDNKRTDMFFVLSITKSRRRVFSFEKWKRIDYFLLSTTVFSQLLIDNFDHTRQNLASTAKSHRWEKVIDNILSVDNLKCKILKWKVWPGCSLLPPLN